MGTRARVNVINHDKVILSIYRQNDGYPDGPRGLGWQVADFVGKLRITNGISGDPTGTANGMGCLAAQLVGHLKRDRSNGFCVGNVYIRDTGPDSHGEEFCYTLTERDGRVWMEVRAGGVTMFGNPGDEEKDMVIMFSGFASDYIINPDKDEDEFEITLMATRKMPVRYLQARCGVRYWEDATVDDVEDVDGSRIPCRDGDDWAPLIDLHTGTIINWRPGAVASIHYKVCDDGSYALLDEDKNVVVEIEGYVPSIMAPADNGYGDYVIMDIDKDGKIDKWKVDLKEFEKAGRED